MDRSALPECVRDRDLDFLGPIVEPEIARAVAEGLLDPVTHVRTALVLFSRLLLVPRLNMSYSVT